MMPRTKPNAVVLASGGLDSTTVLAIAAESGFSVHALTVLYGQRHSLELEAARRAADHWAVQHRIIELDLSTIGGSALTDTGIAVPKDALDAASDAGRIPVTYVPARNTILLSLALAYAEVLLASDIFIGVNALDYSGYPDCRPEFIAAFERLANLGTKAGVEGSATFRVHAPLISLTKRQIIERGTALGVDYSQTLSCYDPSPDGSACGHCDACVLRLRGFAEAGISDPATYVQPASTR